MKLTAADLLKYAYYRCTPEVYRNEDYSLGRPLYRYLQSIIMGGGALALKDIDNLVSLVDPEKCPADFFPVLYESFGLEYYPDVEIQYHRKFLMNYGELVKRRGTYACVRFLSKVLTGMDVKMSYVRGEYNAVTGRHLIVALQATTIEQASNLETSCSVVEQFIGLFIPYYITPHVISAVANQTIAMKIYRGGVVSMYKHYTFLHGGD